MIKKYTNKDIRKLRPCHDPIRYYSNDKEYTLIDILDREDIPAADKIWVVTKLIPEKEARLFAVWCAREALKLVGNPDPRSIEACNVAERFAHGKATKDELSDARSAAYAVYAANTVNAAALAAAYAADMDANNAANAVRSAAWAAMAAAWDDTEYAAYYAAQIEYLKNLILVSNSGRLFSHLISKLRNFMKFVF